MEFVGKAIFLGPTLMEFVNKAIFLGPTLMEFVGKAKAWAFRTKP